ncbi:MAG TPA: TOBE domain-containing protein, partial [Solirubrobacteraceae bacterium]|nr:TOBE domain-containing protein [Solirubrobacteraceae bacterium]
GSAAELATRPAAAFVADFTGSSVLHGDAQAGADGLTAVRLDGGGTVVSSDRARGEVAATVQAWEITLHPDGDPLAAAASALNTLRAEIVAVTPLGNRVRVGLALPQPLTVEVTEAASKRLALKPGASVIAAWKATATRLVPR